MSVLDRLPDELTSLALDDPPEPTGLAGLAVPVPVLPADAGCRDVERAFGRDPHLSSLLVRHPEAGQVVGLVQRRRFEAVMSGPFGYGRALHARSRAVDVADWDALVLRPGSGVIEAATRAITRPAERVDDDVVVQDATSVTVVPVAVLLAALARSLAARALRDTLTGLANRDAFFGRIDEACRRSATREEHTTAVVYLDLDGFKGVNDAVGHGGGDDLLRRVAAALRASARPGDVVSRLGGDEFAVCVECEGDRDQAVATAAALADRLLAAVRSVDTGAASTGPARASVGLALTGSGPVDPDELIRAADLAMYRSKRMGGDRRTEPVVVSSSADADPLAGTSITEAARRGELVLHFQPIVALEDLAVVSVEALVRWEHPRLGLLAPGAFLPAVERAGQLPDLDAWVLDAACREFAAWTAALGRPDLRLNVNVSVPGLLQPDVVDQILEVLRRSGLPAGVLRVEVSEDLLAETIDAVRPALQGLAAAGVAVTFDDVGAGSTSLRHLRDVAADGLKIDRSYVAGMLAGERDRAVVQLLVDFGIGTGSRVTAEGIETEEARDLLLAMGCTYGQGYLFGRPAPLADLDVPSGRL